MTKEQRYDDLYKLLHFFSGSNLESEMDFHCEDGTIRVYLRCNDLFHWGCSDAEEVTAADIPEITRALNEFCKDYHSWSRTLDAVHLFIARKRGMRPQGCCYPEDKNLWPLFDACGPEREGGIGCSNARKES